MDICPTDFVCAGAAWSIPRAFMCWPCCLRVLLIVFQGVTNRLIPLYAVGAFLAFTLSQAGMVAHWLRVKGPGYRRYIVVNGFGALATGATVLVVLVAKFIEGAWITALLIPTLLILMMAVKRYFDRVAEELQCTEPFNVEGLNSPLIILPVQKWSRLTRKAVEVAYALSRDVEAVHVCVEGEKNNVREEWEKFVTDAVAKSWHDGAETYHAGFTVSVCDYSDCESRAGGAARESHAPNRRGNSRNDRASLVALFPGK